MTWTISPSVTSLSSNLGFELIDCVATTSTPGDFPYLRRAFGSGSLPRSSIQNQNSVPGRSCTLNPGSAGRSTNSSSLSLKTSRFTLSNAGHTAFFTNAFHSSSRRLSSLLRANSLSSAIVWASSKAFRKLSMGSFIYVFGSVCAVLPLWGDPSSKRSQDYGFKQSGSEPFLWKTKNPKHSWKTSIQQTTPVEASTLLQHRNPLCPRSKCCPCF